MLGRSSRPRGGDDEAGVHQPLLNDSDEDLPSAPTRADGNGNANGNVLFSVDDGSDDEFEDDLLGTGKAETHAEPTKPVRSVRFQEEAEVRVFSQPLRSTMESRETGA